MFFLILLFTIVELNCENLFDTQHDSLKHDEEFLPTAAAHWTPYRYWHKLNRIGQDILSCGDMDSNQVVPDLVILTETENDSVLHDLTKRSLLRNADYEYVMTDSPDERGIDVALLYSPFSFGLIGHHSIRITPPKGCRPTRDILYVYGQLITGDTLHIFGVHAPSRSGGELATRPYRLHVVSRLLQAVDSVRALSPHALVVVAGDFNDYSTDASLQLLTRHGLTDVSANAHGRHGAKGTYRYHGLWGSLDHILCNANATKKLVECHINDAPFLLVADEKYGGVKPRRNYLGPRYLDGFSDHLPLVATFILSPSSEALPLFSQ